MAQPLVIRCAAAHMIGNAMLMYVGFLQVLMMVMAVKCTGK
jgi:hypothetical protein